LQVIGQAQHKLMSIMLLERVKVRLHRSGKIFNINFIAGGLGKLLCYFTEQSVIVHLPLTVIKHSI